MAAHARKYSYFSPYTYIVDCFLIQCYLSADQLKHFQKEKAYYKENCTGPNALSTDNVKDLLAIMVGFELCARHLARELAKTATDEMDNVHRYFIQTAPKDGSAIEFADSELARYRDLLTTFSQACKPNPAIVTLIQSELPDEANEGLQTYREMLVSLRFT